MDATSLGADALQKLKTAFPAERWSKIQRQATQRCGLDADGLQGLCAKLIAASHARHPDNETAVLYSAANRLLLSVGSILKPEDVERVASALNAVPAKKRGGKHDPAPVPASSN